MKGAKGQKRSADVIGNAVKVMRIEGVRPKVGWSYGSCLGCGRRGGDHG
jgi:hypothetical protein